MILAGQSKDQMFETIKAALDKNELPTPATGATCHVMSEQEYLSDRDGHWHPRLMFFVPQADHLSWGANLAGFSDSGL